MYSREVGECLVRELEQDLCAPDLSFGFDAALTPLVPPGAYIVAFVKADQHSMFRTKKLFLHWRIIEPSKYDGVTLFQSFNVPTDGTKWGLGHKFLATWILANGARPVRRDRLSTSVFRKKYFQARVVTVKKNSKGLDRPESTQYSVVDELVSVVAGGTHVKP